MFRLPTLKYYFDEQRDSNIISYSFPDIGDYNMHVFLDGEDIIGSPFHVICKPQLNGTSSISPCLRNSSLWLELDLLVTLLSRSSIHD